MKNYLIFTFLLFASLNLSETKASSSSENAACDTLVTTEGRTYICHILRHDKHEIRFSFCDDPNDRVYAIPTNRVASVKKAQLAAKLKPEPAEKKLRVVQQSEPKKDKPKAKTKAKPKEESLESLSKEALTIGISSIIFTATIVLLPLGFILGIIAINKAERALRRGKNGEQLSKKVRRRLRWAKALGIIGSIGAAVLLALVLLLISQFEPVGGDFDISLGGGWCWSCGG
ncbi:MAG: hypothetical protein JNJ57_12185 [Saprospiraceae bacterium]|nr:hypothetical protein [Saprospiraceae bacterium]